MASERRHGTKRSESWARTRAAGWAALGVLAVACAPLAYQRGRAQARHHGSGLGPGQLELKLQLSPAGPISAGEPVLAQVEVHNITGAPVRVPVGSRHTYFGVYDAEGALVGRPPAADFLGLTGLESLEPGAVRLAYFSLDPWFRFDKPGTYLVRAEQLEPGPTETRREQRPGPDGKQQTVVVAERTSVTVAQAEASMTVVPLDPQRLEARCQELFDTMRELRGGPLYQATGHALMSVRHDVALPYLEHMAMAPSRAACVAIRRVGTPRAEKLIQALAARNDGVGEAARQALDTSLEPPAPTPDTHLSR